MAMDGLDSLGGSRLRNGHSMTHASRIADQDRTESGNDTKTKNFQEVPSPAVVSADAELGQILCIEVQPDFNGVKIVIARFRNAQNRCPSGGVVSSSRRPS